MAAFNNLDEVAVFFGLALIYFTDWFLANSSMWQDWMRYSEWYPQQAGRTNKKWMLWFWVLPFSTTLLFIFQMAACYIFYQFVFVNADGVWWEVACVTFFMLINVLTAKQWIAIYTTAGKHRGWAFVLLIANLLTAIAVAVIFAYYNRWLEFGLYLPASLIWWCLVAAVHWWSVYIDFRRSTRAVLDVPRAQILPEPPRDANANASDMSRHMKVT